jgi:hypothetical protein
MKSLKEKYKIQSPAFLLNEKEIDDLIYFLDSEEKNKKR